MAHTMAGSLRQDSELAEPAVALAKAGGGGGSRIHREKIIKTPNYQLVMDL